MSKERRHLQTDFEVKAVETAADGRIDTITILAAVFGNIDDQGDVIRKGAFQETITKRVPRGIVKFVDNHDYAMKSTYGTVIDAQETDRGLRVTVKFASTEDAQKAAKKIQEEHINQFSIGFIPEKKSRGKQNGKRVRFLDKVELKEVTGTAVAINDKTEVLDVSRKSAQKLLKSLDEEGDLDWKALMKALDEQDAIELKGFPSDAPFTDFSSCVQWANEEDVDSPGSYCSQLRAGFAEWPPSKSADEEVEKKFLDFDEGDPNQNIPADAPFNTHEECLDWHNQTPIVHPGAKNFCQAIVVEGIWPPPFDIEVPTGTDISGAPGLDEDEWMKLSQNALKSFQSGRVQDDGLTEKKASVLRSAIIEVLRQSLDEGVDVDFGTIAEAILSSLASKRKSVDPSEIDVELSDTQVKALKHRMAEEKQMEGVNQSQLEQAVLDVLNSQFNGGEGANLKEIARTIVQAIMNDTPKPGPQERRQAPPSDTPAPKSSKSLSQEIIDRRMDLQDSKLNNT